MFFLSYYPTHIIITIITTLGLFSNFTLILRVYETERPDSVEFLFWCLFATQRPHLENDTLRFLSFFLFFSFFNLPGAILNRTAVLPHARLV